jgi:hypothetical protein
LKEEVEYGFLERLVGVFEAKKEILALAPYRDHLDVRCPHDICQRIRDRAVHLHVVLVKIASLNMEREAE